MKSALITGAASGIGRACAVRMAQEGYGAVIADVNMDAANALADKAFAFEAVAEGLEEKQSVYQAVERFADPDAVIASCTSSIDAEILAGLARRPEQLLIAHPFQPVHMLPLVEVVRHEKPPAGPSPGRWNCWNICTARSYC